mmetsp:Transcript_43220/g.57191  ORF Transcript_43220/g.57191 Transcript_43220/m.57191 type:complete len:83 (-) Transcript_43220:68-316(-)|eukprot:CAMPEP_0185581688 /NCGR_PEP_ID=MMETSP0434-20130131/18746_1 /TAXON_ID=626734 ORGANISM="Favella taraikaensis, Strain Fe Narragansett Bay" /NCGR_SAMPLE_ID=MMETSP0434 /ASSEMBLY_ACC=CAM_ASM_000379 /LENGTH=82 /DNA_ID=CAMNT_0028200287 /DNA_START=384 /DNA_END=635 /DNA_ORIENTATION=+
MLLGGPGTKKLTITASSSNEGTSTFRALYAQPWEFHGWDSFDSANVEERDFVTFPVSVSAQQETTGAADGGEAGEQITQNRL